MRRDHDPTAAKHPASPHGLPLVAELSIGQLAEVVEGQLTLGTMPPPGRELEPVGRIVDDSRIVSAGDLFWGFPGQHVDGSQFAEEALWRSAAGTLVARRHVEPWAGAFSIRVDDADRAIDRLARWARSRFQGAVISITGSLALSAAGTMIRQIAQSAWSGSLAQQVRTRRDAALAMASWQTTDAFAILEVVAEDEEKKREISHLCSPEIAAISSFQNAHQKSASGLEAIAEIHARLLMTLPEDTWAVLNGDDPTLRRAAQKRSTRVVWVGSGSDCDIVPEAVHRRDALLAVRLDQQDIVLPVERTQGLDAVTTAFAVGRLMKFSSVSIANALAKFTPATEIGIGSSRAA